ncbi:Glycosyl transferase, family 2 [Sulfobacillus acidophilus TPY]|uniref:Glycosyl transferase family 2 n=1 Tax=Sulfobacillus acidophilus (strain ATCC 700253 / DSM 10332 / NAL) TaxID=679936 RepID=G8TT68_SULAD|nr:Glycosyl transferase, family 2 [Sulfobacillus acidophilus TPY]AEW06768.1 glycosyl transferase family 2 [Sulfobacillus acidophilus DSM 10332]
MTVSVVVATYNREEVLLETVADLLQQSYTDREIIVVDQSPTHEAATRRQLTDWHQQGRIRWVRLESPGLTRARNYGISLSQGEYVVFVDDDVRILDQDFLRHYVTCFQETGAAAIAGRVLEPDRPPLRVKRRIGDLGFFGQREPGFGSDWSGPAYSVRGCNMAFRRTVLDEVGGFDEGFTRSAFREDTDVAWRIRERGYAIWFCHTAWLYHLSAPSGGTRDRSIQFFEDVIENDIRFASRRLKGARKWAWLARLYASRVAKAGWTTGHWRSLHQAYMRALSRQRREASP